MTGDEAIREVIAAALLAEANPSECGEGWHTRYVDAVVDGLRRAGYVVASAGDVTYGTGGMSSG